MYGIIRDVSVKVATGVAPDVSAYLPRLLLLEAVSNVRYSWENLLSGLTTWLDIHTDALN